MLRFFRNSKLYFVAFLSITLFFTACGPSVNATLNKSVSYPVIDHKQDIVVLSLYIDIPKEAIVIGKIKISDSGFSTDCDYQTAIERAKLEARKAGGNAIKITSHKQPDIWSTCHRITADILRIEDTNILNELSPLTEEVFEGDYALLYIYRISNFGALISYDLHFNDSEICRISNKSKTEVKIYDETSAILWAKTESKTELPVKFKHGRKYYIRCGIRMGAFVGVPTIELVDIQTGKAEYSSLKEKK